MTERHFLCYYEGLGNEWEAISVDYDIAVCGHSLDDVKDLLKSAILTYIEDANKEEERARKRLLSRRMPKMVQLGWVLKINTHRLRSKRENAHSDGRFKFSCPA